MDGKGLGRVPGVPVKITIRSTSESSRWSPRTRDPEDHHVGLHGAMHLAGYGDGAGIGLGAGSNLDDAHRIYIGGWRWRTTPRLRPGEIVLVGHDRP